MSRLLVLLAMLISTASLAAPQAINITSPVNYQTVFNTAGNVVVKFDINATTLYKLPAKVQLYLNNQPVSEIRYGAASSFDIKGLQNGQYTVIVTATGHDGKMISISSPIKFTFMKKGFEIAL